jgi:hypothetical protein
VRICYSCCMSARGSVWLLVALAACRSATPSARERVLDKLPASASVVIAADGKALATRGFKAIVDRLRPEWPPNTRCVFDAAVKADQVAMAQDDRGIVVVLDTRAKTACPMLSHVDGDLWVATVGDAQLASGESILADDRFERARKYLEKAPLAIAMDDPVVGRFLATASPEPLEAWLAIDANDPAAAAAIERELRGLLARLTNDVATSSVAGHVAIRQDGLQVVAETHDATAADLAAIVRAVLRTPPRITPRQIPANPTPAGCPTPQPPVVGCGDDGKMLIVSSLGAVADALGTGVEPVVADGQVDGLRVTRDIASLGLVRGDVIFAVGGRRISRAVQLVDDLRAERRATTLSFRRAGQPTVLAITQR